MSPPSESRTDVSSWELIRVETRGASEKVWIREHGGSSKRPETDWLFKPATTQSDGTRQVGDWTEVVGSRIATALEVPSAESRLAIRDGLEGVIVRNVRPSGYDMVTGRLAMLHAIDIALRDSLRDRTASVGHSLDNIERTLENYGPPPGADSWSRCTGFDVMVGYLHLDALLGNGDRHEQNWSVLRATSSLGSLPDALAGSYDLEASLGFQLTDEARLRRLSDPAAMRAFAGKGHARRFDGHIKTPLVDFAALARDRCSPDGKNRIDDLIEGISKTDFADILGGCGGVSETTRTFALEALRLNGRRIYDAA